MEGGILVFTSPAEPFIVVESFFFLEEETKGTEVVEPKGVERGRLFIFGGFKNPFVEGFMFNVLKKLNSGHM